MMYCERCQVEYPEDKKFCRHCGDPLEPKPGVPPADTARCPHCQVPVLPEDTFCHSCGASLGERPTVLRELSRPSEPDRATPGAEKPGAEEKSRRQPQAVTPAEEPLRCPQCREPVLPGDVVCASCGASLVDEVLPSSAKERGVAPGAARREEEEALFALEEELRQRRTGLLWGVGKGIGTGALLTGLIVGGLYIYQTRFQPAVEPPPAVVEPPATVKPPAAVEPPPVPTPTPAQPAGQIMTMEGSGLEVSGAGVQDAGRSLLTIREQVEAHFPELRQVYDRSLQTNPSLKGSVLLHMTVTPAGKVVYVKAVPAGIDDTTFVDSVQAQAQTWQFPAASAGIVSVHYPLLFYPQGTDPQTLIAALPAAKPEPVAVPKGPKAPADEAGFPRKYRVTRSTNVRDKPTWASKAVADLQEGTKITVVGKEGDWLKVQPKNPANPPGYVWKDHAVAQ